MDDPDGVVTQECLNKHPLDRAPYTGSGSPIDPSYPGRYYLDPPCRKHEVEQSVSSNFESDLYEAYNVKMRYVLPDIACEHCVLQMHWSELFAPAKPAVRLRLSRQLRHSMECTHGRVCICRLAGLAVPSMLIRKFTGPPPPRCLLSPGNDAFFSGPWWLRSDRRSLQAHRVRRV